MKSLIHDKDGQVSGSKFWFTVCSTIVLLKYLFADTALFGEFDEQGAAMLLATFGGVYWGRANTKKEENKTTGNRKTP